MSKLSKETIDKIQRDANSMADKKLEELKKAFNPDYEKLFRFIEGYHSGVVAGATEWAGRAQPGIELLEKMIMEFIGAAEMSDKEYDKELIKKSKAFIAKYKEARNV